jgi:multimeric flavodoxin WrbA
VRVLVLLGSHRKNGNSSRVVGLVEEGLQQLALRHSEPLTVERVYLGHQDIGWCRGCRMCFDQREEMCSLKDDLLELKAKMSSSDGIILASPVYVQDVSGTVKNWMDRLAHACHRPAFAGKSALLVATVGDGPAGHALRTMKTALSLWGFHIAAQASFKMGARMEEDEVKARYQRQAADIAGKLFDSIRERRFARPSFVSLLTFKIQQLYWQRHADDSVDYRYWRKLGWTEPQREFYIQHQASRLKVALARLAGAALAPFVT